MPPPLARHSGTRQRNRGALDTWTDIRHRRILRVLSRHQFSGHGDVHHSRRQPLMPHYTLEREHIPAIYDVLDTECMTERMWTDLGWFEAGVLHSPPDYLLQTPAR